MYWDANKMKLIEIENNMETLFMSTIIINFGHLMVLMEFKNLDFTTIMPIPTNPLQMDWIFYCTEFLENMLSKYMVKYSNALNSTVIM